MSQALPTLPAEKESTSSTRPAEPDPGFGALSTERGCLPLIALDVRTRIDGLVARTEVRQTFVNAHPEPLEATYVFPLPDRAAVTSFRLEVAGRVVEGEIHERGRARQEYDRALCEGHRAAIAEEDRPGVFTLRVGNLPPGEKATVRLSLVGPLPYSAGEATFRFPLVVAPRYVPGVPLPGPQAGDGTAPDTDAVPDASRISPPVLLPGFPNPVRLSLAVEVAPSALAPHDFRSSLHTVEEEQEGPWRRFRLRPGERLDRDFVLRFRLGADRVQTSLSVQPDPGGEEGTFLLTVVPPAPASHAQPRLRRVVFVLDRSGSMDGWKMVAARRAVVRMVETLTERDSFTVFAFDDAIETPPDFDGTGLVPATPHLRFRAAEFLTKVEARGGTEMARPLERAVTELARTPAGGSERILVLITDGQVANEDQVLRQLGRRSHGVRIFTLGVDRAVNSAFLRRLADLGGGATEVVESEARLDEVMDHVHRLLGTPVLTGLRLEPAGVPLLPDTLAPGRLPDLFADTPVLIAGRYRGESAGSVTLTGRDSSGGDWSARPAAWCEPPVTVEPGEGSRPTPGALAGVWARARLRELEDAYASGAGDRAALEKEIVATSLRFGVLCRFTAFVAVDRSAVVNPGGQVHGVVQPVELPSGWGGTLGAGLTPPGALGAVYRAGDVTCSGVLRLRVEEVESVDSMLMFDAEETDRAFSLPREVPECRPALPAPSGRKGRGRKRSDGAAKGEGLLHRLLGLFRRRVAPPAGFDRTPFRRRVEESKTALEVALAGAPDKVLAALAAELPGLETLFRDLVAAGDRDPAVERLGRLVLRARALVAGGPPDESDAAALCRELVDTLGQWLGLPAAPPARREGFWK